MDLIKKINNGNIWVILDKISVNEMAEIIKIAADYYYNENTPLISDKIFDIIVDRLKEIDPKNKILKTIGSPAKGKKVKLPHWMGSMDKIKTDGKELDKWISKYPGPYVISDKLDGISCLMTKDKKGRVTLYTRGDGSHGQDISHLIDYINIGDVESYNAVTVRGELIISKKNFSKFSKVMSSARSMAAGIVNSKPSSLNPEYATQMEFVVYEMIEPGNMKPMEQLHQLDEWGFDVVNADIFNEIDFEKLEKIFEKRKKKSIYDIDGLIVTQDKKHVRNSFGNPSYAFAYKGQTETADVKVLEVIWEAGKDGLLIPTVRYEKVRLSQGDLEYATGFNAKFIVDNNIGPGAIIKVVRSGDVIPYIMEVMKPAKKVILPDEDFYWDKNGVNIILEDPENNRSVKIKRLTKFVKDIGVENMSEGIITKLVNNGIESIFHIVSLTKDDLQAMEGFQETLATKLIKNMKERLKEVDVLKLMVASNIFGRGFGRKKLKKVLDEYPEIVNEYREEDYDNWYVDLMDLDGLDDISVTSFLEGMAKFKKFYNKFNKYVSVLPYKKTVKKGHFTGMTIVFTGFREKEWEKVIEEQGGKLSGSVSKNTDLVVHKDDDDSSLKFKKAKQLNIPTMNKTKFMKKFGV